MTYRETIRIEDGYSTWHGEAEEVLKFLDAQKVVSWDTYSIDLNAIDKAIRPVIAGNTVFTLRYIGGADELYKLCQP